MELESYRVSAASVQDELELLLSVDRLTDSELLWSLFCSALASFKRETLVRPFPPQFISIHNTKDFHSLIQVAKSIPNLRLIKQKSLDSVQRNLLLWVLNTRKFSLKPLSQVEDDSPIKSAVANAKIKPTHLYEVTYEESQRDKFADLANGRSVITAFHGSRLANFYSILHHGLIANMNKTAAFGEGTYLSSDLNVSLNWSPQAQPGFSGSAERMSCIAVCDVIEDPVGMKSSFGPSPGVKSSLDSQVPERYVIVQNDCLVRLRYLLVYSHSVKTSQRQLGSSVMHLVRDHLFLLVMLFYLALLMFVGLYNSRNFTVFMRKWSDLWQHEPSYDDL